MAEKVQYTFEIVGLDKLNKAENDLKTLTKQLNQNQKAQEIINNTQKKNASQVAALTEEYKRNKKAQEIARQEKKKYADQLKREVAVRQAVRGSIGKVNALLAVEKQRIKDVVVGSAQYNVMATRIKNLETRQRAFNVQMGRSGTFVGEYARGFKQGFAQIGIAIAGALAAFRGLQKVIGGSLEAYAKQEAAERSLQRALGGTSQAINNLASARQKLTSFGDEETIQASAFLAQQGATEKQIIKLIPLIQDYAAAYDLDLDTAAKKVNNTIFGVGTTLKGTDVQFTQSSTTLEKYNGVVDSLNANFKDEAENLANVDGGLKQLENSLGDSQEQFGRLVSVLLDKVIPGFNEAIGSMNQFNDTLLDGIENGESFIEMSANLYGSIAGEQVDAIATALNEGIIDQEEFNRRVLILAQEKGTTEAEIFTKAVKNRIVEIRELEEAERLKSEAKELQDLEEQQKKALDIYKKGLAKKLDEKKKADAEIRKAEVEKNEIEFQTTDEKNQKELDQLTQDLLNRSNAYIENENVIRDADEETQKQRRQRQKQTDEEIKQSLLQQREFAINSAQQLGQAVLQIEQKDLNRKTARLIAFEQERFEKGFLTEQQLVDNKKVLEKNAFEDSKRIALAQAGIDGAAAVLSILAQYPKFDGGIAMGLAIAAAGVTTATQIALISNQKYAKGGLLEGNSHAFGGIPTPFGEMEGGEAVINKASTAMFRPLLSQINQAGGGVKFADGGITPNQNIQQVQTFDIASQLRNIKVVNVATETTDLAIFVENEQTADNF